MRLRSRFWRASRLANKLTTPSIGFIGFGEAGSTIAAGLRSVADSSLFAYDIKSDDSTFGPTIRARAAQSGTTVVASSSELAHEADVLISVVTSSSALDAANQTAPFLKSGQ